MSEKDYSQAAFLEFLRMGAVTGITNPAIARSRKLAAEQLLGQVKSHESLDLRLLDVDELCTRFHKLQGSAIRPETIQLYNERLSSGLKDFVDWVSNPVGFQAVEGEQKEEVVVASRDDEGQAKAREELVLNPPRSPFEIFPIPIRDDLVVYLQNIPLNLTSTEAAKISAVVSALAVPEEDK